ncbi:MAG TPA: metallophosphoesterase family protein [Candidatus Limnocylindrales bacterium]|nr:metallophosphoesterase family protein [Candidatus Limnocylindrales bacterium]
MKIALVSDTHLPRFGRALPRALLDGFEREGIDRILHAGDWTEPLAVALLEAVAPVDGVAGNNDGRALQERFGTRRVIELADASATEPSGGVHPGAPGSATEPSGGRHPIRIGLTHGHLGPGATTRDRARRAFRDEHAGALAAIVFGHSHIPLVERLDDGTWLVNPGSPTDKRRQATFSWSVMEASDGGIASVRLVRYEDRSA